MTRSLSATRTGLGSEFGVSDVRRHWPIGQRQIEPHPIQHIGDADIAEQVERQRAVARHTLEQPTVRQRRKPIVKSAVGLRIKMEDAIAAQVGDDALVEIIADHVHDQTRRPVGRANMPRIGEILAQRRTRLRERIGASAIAERTLQPPGQALGKRDQQGFDAAIAHHRNERPRIGGIVVVVGEKALCVRATAIDVMHVPVERPGVRLIGGIALVSDSSLGRRLDRERGSDRVGSGAARPRP